MKRIFSAIFGLLAFSGLSAAQMASNHEPKDAVPPAASVTTAKAVLAGGCFWCVEHDFRQLPGVINVVSGYSGGALPKPTYQTYHDVSAANPVPHTEVVEVTYDTAKLSYDRILDFYVRHIDPTDGGGQFCDRGSGYAPVIFTASELEKAAATAKLAEVAAALKTKIAVRIADATPFWAAEAYHQNYAAKNPIRYKIYRGSCGRDARVTAVWGQAAH
jgi:peptide-methionine (S)-S-oxide reductase